MKKVFFERAIFLNWYCSKQDCAFCYMSTLKGKVDKDKSRRTRASIFAEALICKKLNWKIEFLSGGYDALLKEEILDILKNIYSITKEKQWLNIGVLTKEDLLLFEPYIKGVAGTVECINSSLREKLCPSKPLNEITEMFKICDEFGLQKAMTIIIGLGETKNDIPKLLDFIKKYFVNRVTFYALKPQEGTIFKKGPTTKYYVEWIKRTRVAFPKLQIIAGTWSNRLGEVKDLLLSGADNITKLPAIKILNSKKAKELVFQVESANRTFESKFYNIPKIDWNNEIDKLFIDENLKDDIKKKMQYYTKSL
ncbi:MAG: radical SAM protein [Nanoarchaeota archaeon]|nr:radical SAM protein [Nanoarchaeota archaeon]MBU1030369.1 radical SAM protein [Nanoarchaeota archaeon]MBU1850290.1 radical SAM protein [Nanoarchaeota archaeon]